MPVHIPKTLPAVETLRGENIIVMTPEQTSVSCRLPLKLLVLNLMPLKIETETDLIRLLSNSPLQIDIDFLHMASHTSRNTPMEHMKAFYNDFDAVRENRYDGMIITGAPVEMIPFEEVDYWEELKVIFDWARVHATSTLYICWAAQAGLYHYYGVQKHPLPRKMFGVFEHKPLLPEHPIFRGFDDVFYVPHSRHTEVRVEDIRRVQELTLLAESAEAGVYMVMGRNGRELFVTGHSEYPPRRLDTEYRRDLAKGLPIEPPRHYYRDDNPANPPVVRWRSHANLLFTNWLNLLAQSTTAHRTSL